MYGNVKIEMANMRPDYDCHLRNQLSKTNTHVPASVLQTRLPPGWNANAVEKWRRNKTMCGHWRCTILRLKGLHATTQQRHVALAVHTCCIPSTREMSRANAIHPQNIRPIINYHGNQWHYACNSCKSLTVAHFRECLPCQMECNTRPFLLSI